MHMMLNAFCSRALPAVALGMTLSFGLSLDAAAHQQQDHELVPADADVSLFEGLGDHHFPITTQSETAQAYFDQGLIFTYGFNHFEAVRSFREAVRHDEDCAMCYWGVALALGPHINAPMMPDDVQPALQQALALAPEAREREQAYVEAVSERYSADPPEDRQELDRAYADAMRDVAERYPDDLDAQTLFAESLMNLVAWDYWADDGEPRGETAERAVELQDTLPYMEPPYWSNSARLDLGRALLEADRPAEAEEVYRADLEDYPRNGWALYGLAHSLKAQGEDEAAEEVAVRFEDAWQHADTRFAEGSVELSQR
jgi:tetratricopeptide (TPR) repeat protein